MLKISILESFNSILNSSEKANVKQICWGGVCTNGTEVTVSSDSKQRILKELENSKEDVKIVPIYARFVYETIYKKKDSSYSSFEEGQKLAKVVLYSESDKIYFAPDVSRLFEGFSSLESINLPSIKTTYVKRADAMFLNCRSLYIVPKFRFPNIESAQAIFSGSFPINRDGIIVSIENTLNPKLKKKKEEKAPKPDTVKIDASKPAEDKKKELQNMMQEMIKKRELTTEDIFLMMLGKV